MEKSEKRVWALNIEELFSYLKSSDKGLTDEEVKLRLKQNGPNEIPKEDKRKPLEIFGMQFSNPLIIILIVAAVFSWFLQEKVDAGVIIVVVFITAILGFLQEYKAEKALSELEKFLDIKAKVIRNGKITEIDSRDLVPGDIVILKRGEVIPADIRLIEVENMTTEESSLTGESVPVLKTISTISEENSIPQYLKNIAFMGTSVASGTGKGVVCATGKNTFFGNTANYIKIKEPETDFQKNIRLFSNLLLRIIIVMTIFIFVANAALGRELIDSFLFATALAVGITPEVLPVIITITLSNGALKMAKEKVITKRLVSVEDLGNIDILCCDKTGTLTEEMLTLQKCVNIDGKEDHDILKKAVLCNSSAKNIDKSTDDHIDRAIMSHIEGNPGHKVHNDLKKYSVTAINPFDFSRRRMSVIAKSKGKQILIVKGAPESILNTSTHAIIGRKIIKIDKKIRQKINSMISAYEEDGYTAIAIAEKQFSPKTANISDEKELTFIGMLLFLDPPRKTVKESLEHLQLLGVGIKIISGDSPVITRKICNEVHLKIIDDKVVTGEELSKLNYGEFDEYCNKYNIFSRVTPEQKYEIVTALKKSGHVVGYFGDGINDAPALRVADVGISINTASGIAKDAADIIILEKSLKVIAHGIVSGRRTFGNITKYITNTMSANCGNMLTVALSSLFMTFIPLLPSQILLNNLMSDIPNLTIATDNVDNHSLKKPKKWDLSFISRFIFFFGCISTVFDLLLIVPLLYIFKTAPDTFRTAWFVESVLSEIIIVFAIRTTLPFFKSVPSRLLWISSLMTGLAAIFVTFIPFTQKMFTFVALPTQIICYIFIILLLYFITTELGKVYFFRREENVKF